MDMELVNLIDAALDQIRKDVEAGDFSAIEELLAFVPKDKLKEFLPEAV
jgi:hypothetical protein